MAGHRLHKVAFARPGPALDDVEMIDAVIGEDLAVVTPKAARGIGGGKAAHQRSL